MTFHTWQRGIAALKELHGQKCPMEQKTAPEYCPCMIAVTYRLLALTPCEASHGDKKRSRKARQEARDRRYIKRGLSL